MEWKFQNAKCYQLVSSFWIVRQKFLILQIVCIALTVTSQEKLLPCFQLIKENHKRQLTWIRWRKLPFVFLWLIIIFKQSLTYKLFIVTYIIDDTPNPYKTICFKLWICHLKVISTNVRRRTLCDLPPYMY